MEWIQSLAGEDWGGGGSVSGFQGDSGRIKMEKSELTKVRRAFYK